MGTDVHKLLCVMLCYATWGCGRQEQAVEKPVWVMTDTVRMGVLGESLRFPARVKASREVNLAFKAGGTLERLYVEEGSRVRQGELVAQMDSRDYRLQLQAVEAEYRDVRAAAERVFALYADSVATEADYDKARYGLEQMAAKYEAAGNRLAETRLTAPFDGYVKRCLLYPPAVVGAGMPVLVLQSSEALEVEMYVPAPVVLRQKEIAAFTVTFDYFPRPFPLHLLSISPTANASQLYAVRLSLPDTLVDRPAVGMVGMVDVAFHPEEESGDVMVPASAVWRDGGKCYVWTVSGGRVGRRHVVMKRLHTDGSATLSSGLDGGDVIVSAGVRSLRENQLVEPLPEASENHVEGMP